MRWFYRVMVPLKPLSKPRLVCLHGELRGQCIKNSRCPLRPLPLLWKWMAEFRYKRDAQRYAKRFKNARIIQDEVI